MMQCRRVRDIRTGLGCRVIGEVHKKSAAIYFVGDGFGCATSGALGNESGMCVNKKKNSYQCVMVSFMLRKVQTS